MLIGEKYTISINELHSITIDELRNSKQLSVRASNCCLNGQLYNLYDIVQYYQEYNSFLNLRNVGRKSSQELEEFCKKIIPIIDYNAIPVENEEYDDNLTEQEAIIDQDAIKDYIQNNLLKAIEEKTVNLSDFFNYISPEKSNFLKKQYSSLIPNYSTRVANRLKEIDYDDFIKKYLFNYNEALLDIKHIGRKSYTELIDFKEKFKSEFSKILKMTKEDYEIEVFLKEHSETLKDEFIYNFYFENKYLPMFWRLEKEYKSKSDQRDMDIFINSYPILNNNRNLSLDELGKKHNISRERARQIRNKIFERKINLKEDIANKTKDWDYYKSHFENEKIIWNDDPIIIGLLRNEKCSFSTSFILLLLSEVCKATHTLFGNYFAIDKKWNKCALINKAYSDIFNFDNLFNDFDTLISNNNSVYYLDVNNFILNSLHWIDFRIDKINDVVFIVKDILLIEFGLYPEDDGRIIIPANKQKNSFDVVYEILKKNNKPMHLNDIFHEFKNILPNHHYKEPFQLRPTLQQHEKISYRGRKSVYTLIEWKHVKSGTIRDCIKEFLAMQETPQSIDKITEYVLQHFPKTNSSSIRTTMLNAPNGQYVYFSNNLFGIKGKKYPSQYIVSKPNQNKRRTFEQRLLDLEKFIIEKEHFPFSSSKDSKEVSLYRWWVKVIEGTLQISDSQAKEVLRIKEQYADFNIDNNTYFWLKNYNKCKSFLLDNKRQPQSKGVERTLYGWLRRAKDDYFNNRLDNDQRNKYIEIVKLM